jgi:hypothetical protein
MNKSFFSVTMATLLGIIPSLTSSVFAISNTNGNQNIAQTQRASKLKCFAVKNESIIIPKTLTKEQRLFLQRVRFAQPAYEDYLINRSAENIMQSCLKRKAKGVNIFGFAKNQVAKNEFEYSASFTRVTLVEGQGQGRIIQGLVIITVKYPGNGANPVISSRRTA